MGEIHQISGWNLVDFMKFLVIAPTLHSSNWRVFAETLAFIIFGFHRWYLGEIHQISPEICWISRISWNPPDFMVKSARFQGEIRMKSTRFHEICMKSVWNLPDFMKSIWNPPDFMKSARFHEIRMKSVWNPYEIRMKSVWNPPDFMNVSFWVMIKYRSFSRKTKQEKPQIHGLRLHTLLKKQ